MANTKRKSMLTRRWREPAPVADPLSQLPNKKGVTYVTEDGKTTFDGRYSWPPDNHVVVEAKRSTRASKRSYNNVSSKTVLGNPNFRGREDEFHARPSIRLPVPDHIKAILVDDWENITKNNQLVPLPHAHPVDKIVNDYLDFERPNRDPDSPHLDILEETVAGLKEYFEKALSRILLYRFERLQYHEVKKLWEKTDEGETHKTVCDTYGAEHLCRLIVSLPELVAQTTMDQQSVARLREELSKFTVWLGKNAKNYFVAEYETPAQDYIDRARSF